MYIGEKGLMTVCKPGVSVIICTFNGALRLPETIAHLDRQKVNGDNPPPIPWEVILVDNASTDNSGEIVVKLWKRQDADLRLVREPNPGLIYARLCGLREAQFEYISFIDDDNWVDERWVQTVYHILHHKPGVGVCGGVVEAICEVTPPPWFEKYKKSYAVGGQGQKTGYVPDEQGYLFGAGLSLRKSAFQLILENGFKPFLTGRKRKLPLSGEDSEICCAFRLAGWKLWYDEQLKLKHFIPKKRLKWKYLCKMSRGFGASHVILDIYKVLNSKEIHLIKPPDFWQRLKKTCTSVWELKHFWGRANKFEGVPEKIYFERQWGKLKSFLKLGKTGFINFCLYSMELKKKLAGLAKRAGTMNLRDL